MPQTHLIPWTLYPAASLTDAEEEALLVLIRDACTQAPPAWEAHTLYTRRYQAYAIVLAAN